MGYHRAGFDVVGVDIAWQPHYPFEFHQADALRVLEVYAEDPYRTMWKSTAIHASPPCQHFTAYRRAVKDIADRYEDLIEPTRELLEATGLPWVMENVKDALLEDPLMLCGSMFDLDVQRHRYFESNVPLTDHPWPSRHGIWSRRFKSSTGRKPNSRFTIEVESWDEPIARQRAAMGVDWPMAVRELSESIPPAYTEFIGAQLLAFVREPAARVVVRVEEPPS